MIKSLGILFLLIISNSCSNNERDSSVTYNPLFGEVEEEQTTVEISDPKGDYIKYGFSFGECSGYCYKEITIEEQKKWLLVSLGMILSIILKRLKY